MKCSLSHTHTHTQFQLVIDLTVGDVRYQGSIICPSCAQICHVSQHPQSVFSTRFIVFSFFTLQDNEDSCPSPGRLCMSIVCVRVLQLDCWSLQQNLPPAMGGRLRLK